MPEILQTPQPQPETQKKNTGNGNCYLTIELGAP